MKVLVGVPDPGPGGFHFTQPNEMVGFKGHVCRSLGCGCDRSWTGLHSKKGATLAQVVAPPPCFNLRPELAADVRVMAAVAIAAKYPVGTLLRATYDWAQLPEPWNADDGDFIRAWIVTPVSGGPN